MSDRFRISENWYKVQDCGGCNDDDCSNQTWEQDAYGQRYYQAYGTGRGWVGKSHYSNPR